MGGGDAPPPPTFMRQCLQEKIDTLIEQSGSRYSNRAVTVFIEAV